MLNLVYHININGIRPIDVVSRVPNRVFLFLHGASDTTIPVTDSEALLAKANKQSTLIIFPNADHVQTYKTNPQLYRSNVYQFIKQQTAD